MRPTDENQAASTRPNLMSSRRGAGEENILAMLERDSARRSGARMTGSRLAWYCAAAAFSGILVGAVAWLAYDNHETVSAMQVQVQAERVAEGDAVQAPPALADAQHPAPAPLPEGPHAAVIVDQPHSMPAAPPLVMLPPEGASRAKAAAPAVKETAPVLASAAPAVVAPAPVKAAPMAPKPKADKENAIAKADKPAKPAPRAAKAQRNASAKTVAARARAKAAARAPADAAVDTDVALISAIIQHAERHRGEREQPAPCSGAKCPPSTRP